MPGSGAITGRSLVGAADVAGPTGVVGCGAAVGAARYGVAGAGAAVRAAGKGVVPVWTPGIVSPVGIGADVATAGATGAGLSAGAKSGADGSSGEPVISRAAAAAAIVPSSSTTNTISDRLGEICAGARSGFTAAAG